MGRLACVSLCSNHAEGVVWLSVPVPEPRVARFEKMAFGMFVHWGLYSLLERGEWILHHSRMPEAEYRKLTERFTAENFDARALARLAKRAGMKYITLSARHHDGFSLYDTRGLSTYDAPHSAAGRDLIAEFVEGCRAEGIVPFLYHTTLDWSFGTADCDEAAFNEYLDYLHASVEILCREYGPLGGLLVRRQLVARGRLERRPAVRHDPQVPARLYDHQQHGSGPPRGMGPSGDRQHHL